MLVRCSLLLRLLTLTTLVVPPFLLGSPSAWAEDEEEDEEEGEGGEGAEEEEEEAVDPDQPLVTAGGLFTIHNYPLSEVERPLTITQKVFEGRAGMNINMSEGVTFKVWVLEVMGRYGISDTLEAFVWSFLDVVTPEGVDATYRVAAGLEPALIYDLVDFRGSIEINITPAKTFFDLNIGFPIKYRLKPNIAIIALDRFFTIHTDGDRKPDLEVGVGGIFQAIPPLALYVKAAVILPEFDTGNEMTVPGIVGLQYAASGKFDVGAEFKLGNLKPPEGQGVFDVRYFDIYMRVRM